MYCWRDYFVCSLHLNYVYNPTLACILHPSAKISHKLTLYEQTCTDNLRFYKINCALAAVFHKSPVLFCLFFPLL